MTQVSSRSDERGDDHRVSQRQPQQQHSGKKSRQYQRHHTLAALAQSAAQHGTAIAVEFMLFSAARTLQECVAIVEAAGEPNVSVLADVLHLTRSGGAPEDLRAVPSRLLPYAQICGAEGAGPSSDPEDARAQAVRARLVPDEGDLPVREFVAALPADCILAVESPLAGQADPADRVALARRMLASAQAVA